MHSPFIFCSLNAFQLDPTELRFHYSVHTIPAIGFELYYSGKSIFYSGDTCNDKKILSDLRDRGIMPEGRYEKLTSFAWHHSVILHEAGVPPIHTPIDVFRNLPEDVKERLYLVHTTSDVLQDDDSLKVAKEGVQNSIVLPVVPNAYLEAYNILEIVSQVEIFSSLTAAQTRDILLIAQKQNYKGGSAIIELGKKGDKFFVIARGVVSVFYGSKMKHLIAGDFFGEMAVSEETWRLWSDGREDEIKQLTVLAALPPSAANHRRAKICDLCGKNRGRGGVL